MLALVEACTEAELPTFEDFWLLYPKREAKKDAAREWVRLSRSDQLDAIVALVDWRRVWSSRERAYIPHAATWLNGERWTDELPPDYMAAKERSPRVFAEREKADADRKAARPMPPELRALIASLRK